MHGKLKLNLDDLRVESFETTAQAGHAEGTVQALCDGTDECGNCTECTNCSECTGCTDCTACTDCSAVTHGCGYTCVIATDY